MLGSHSDLSHVDHTYEHTFAFSALIASWIALAASLMVFRTRSDAMGDAGSWTDVGDRGVIARGGGGSSAAP